MSTAGKVIIIIAICVLFLGVIVVGAGIYWWTRHGRQAVAATAKYMEDAGEAGKKTDNQGCLDQALERYKKDEGFGGAISTSLFLQGCLQESRPTPGFCDDVPSPNDVLKGSAWQNKKCRDAGVPSDQYYRQIFAGVQQYCYRERMKGR
jgi:hypothetical protein